MSLNENERLKIVREKLNIKQKDFADKLGISQQLLSRYELGTLSISDDTKKNLIISFSVNINWLLTGDGQIFFNKKNNFNLTYSEMLPLLNKLAELTPGEKEEVSKFIDSLKKK